MTSGNLTETILPANPLEAKAAPRVQVGHFVAIFLIFATAVMLYSLTRLGNFEGEDLTLMAQLQEKSALGDALGYLTRDWGLEGRYYAPLPRLFFWLEYGLFNNQAGGWHILSALLHSFAAIGVWLVALLLSRRYWLAFWAGMFFAVLPVHMKVVSQAVGQAEILATIFCLAAVACFIIARREKPRPYYILSLVFYVLALLCKQEAIALPLVLLAYDFITGGINRIIHAETGVATTPETEQPSNSQQLVKLYWPFGLILVVYIALNFAFVGGLSVYLPTATQPANPGSFLRGNLRYLADPFDLAGTDGLILVASLLAFLALAGVQEWEAWRVTHREALAALETAHREKEKKAKQRAADEELDDPNLTAIAPATPVLDGAANLTEDLAAEVVPSVAPVAETDHSEPAAEVEKPHLGVPSFRSLRVAGYGLLWAGAFLLPFVLTTANERVMYPASVGFALFLAVALTPFNLDLLEKPGDRKTFSALYGPKELSFWLRIVAAIALFFIYFTATVAKIDEFIRVTKTVAAWFSVHI